MKKIITFGEAMVRLSPPDFKRIEQTEALNITVGGAEFNVAVDLARLEESSSWVSLLPDNPLGKLMRNKAREQGAGVEHVQFKADSRAGIYFVEYGASPRPSKVLYDRKNSAISNITPGDINWEEVFAGAEWFHTTGITPALSESCARETELAIKTAKKLGLFVSYDLNFRGNLWSSAAAQKVTERYADCIDMCVGNEEDTEKVLGLKSGSADEDYSKLDQDSYAETAQMMTDKYGFKYVATTLRESVSVQRNNWRGMLFADGKPYFSTKYELELVDRVGGGDSFSAGLIYSLINNKNPQDSVDFATAYSALKHSIFSDTNWIDKSDVETLLAGGGTRIKR
jgi:2-dehydro-3-deoxygluconokinase